MEISGEHVSFGKIATTNRFVAWQNKSKWSPSEILEQPKGLQSIEASLTRNQLIKVVLDESPGLYFSIKKELTLVN